MIFLKKSPYKVNLSVPPNIMSTLLSIQFFIKYSILNINSIFLEIDLESIKIFQI